MPEICLFIIKVNYIVDFFCLLEVCGDGKKKTINVAKEKI